MGICGSSESNYDRLRNHIAEDFRTIPDYDCYINSPTQITVSTPYVKCIYTMGENEGYYIAKHTILEIMGKKLYEEPNLWNLEMHGEKLQDMHPYRIHNVCKSELSYYLKTNAELERYFQILDERFNVKNGIIKYLNSSFAAIRKRTSDTRAPYLDITIKTIVIDKKEYVVKISDSRIEKQVHWVVYLTSNTNIEEILYKQMDIAKNYNSYTNEFILIDNLPPDYPGQ